LASAQFIAKTLYPQQFADIDPNKTFIIFDSVITSRPDRKDIADGAPATTRRSSALDTAPMHQIAQHCTGN